jgi:hypothetical protein
MEHYPFVDDLPNQHGHFPWLCQITKGKWNPIGGSKIYKVTKHY